MELTQLAVDTAAFLFNVSLRSLLLFVAAGLALLFLRRASAAGRHLLWTMTAGSLLLLPILCAWLPRWDAPVLPSVTTASLNTTASRQAAANVPPLPGVPRQKTLLALPDASRGSIPSAALVKTSASAEKADAESQGTSMPHRLANQASVPAPELLASHPAPLHSHHFAPAQSASSPSASSPVWGASAAEWLVCLWLIGVLVALCRTALSLLAARRLLRDSRLVTDGALVEAARDAGGKLSLSAPLILRAGTAAMPVAVPMTFGVVRPVVLMPMEAVSWPAERLRVVFLHEAAHVKRLDWITAMLAQAVCAVYWFHPLVWLALRRLRLESEQACDDLVLSSGVEAVEYADHLVEVVRRLAGRRVSSAVVTMAYSQEVTGRLKTILAASKNRTAATSRGLAVAILAALVVVLPLAAMRPIAAAGAADKIEAKMPPQTDALPYPQVITVPGDTRSPKQISDWQRINQWRRTLMASRTSPWKATLPDGTCVYLTSLWALNGANAEKTWTPGGTLLSDGGGGSLPFYKNFRSTFCNVDVILVFPSDIMRRQTRVAFGSTEKRPSYGTDLAAFEQNGGYIGSRRFINTGFQYVFPPMQQKTSLAVSLAMGPETVLISGSPLSGAATHLATGETIVLTKAELLPKSSLAQVQFSLPSRFVRNECEYKVVAIDKDGLPLLVPGSSQSYPIFQGENATFRYTFQASKLPLDRIKEFRFTYRPSQTAVFRNVALRPATESAQLPPQSALPLPTAPKPFDFDQTTWAQTAGDAGLKLVAVSDKPANTKRWWRPDGTLFPYDWHQFHVNFAPQNPHVPTAFFQQPPVLIFRSGHPSTTDFSIDGWRDPQAFRPNSHVALAEYICLDQNGTFYSGFVPLLPSNSRAISVRMRVGAGSWQVQDTREVAFFPARRMQDRRTQDVQKVTGSDAVASWTARSVSSTRTEIRLQQPKGIVSGRQVRLVALDSQGREYAPKPGTTTNTDKGSGPVTDYTLAVPLSRIRKFLVEVRPYYYRDFYGIARQPISAAQHTLPMPLALVPSSSIPVPPTTSMTETQKERLASAANLHEIGLALMKYVADHHYRFPDAAHWMDQIIPDLVPSTVTGAARQQRIAAVFHDPASPPSQLWSYSFNRALSSLSLGQIDNPNMIVAVFESSQGVRNASDGGQSLPQPGRHFGGSDFLFADGHTKFLRAEDTPLLIAKLNAPVIDSSGNLTHLTPLQNTTGWFAPVNPEARQKIPIQGQVFNRRTMKPLSSTFVIFSQSPKKITVGSVWPSSFTNKAGRFQSILYPGKNYLMVLENNRFRLVGKVLAYESSGSTGSISTRGTRSGPFRSASSDYVVRWSLPHGYNLQASSNRDKVAGTSIAAFVPVIHRGN